MSLYLVPDMDFEAKAAFDKRFFAAIGRPMSDAGFEFVETLRQPSATQLRVRFSDDPETTHIMVVEDARVGVRYLEIYSEHSSERAERVHRILIEYIEPIDHRAYVERVGRDGLEDPSSLYTVAYSAPEVAVPETVALLRDRLGSTSAKTRMLVTALVGVLTWPELASLLRDAAAVETDERVRQGMVSVLRGLGAEGERRPE